MSTGKGMPRDYAGALEFVGRRVDWIANELEAGRLSAAEADSLAGGLWELLALIVRRGEPARRGPGRPPGKSGGLLSQAVVKRRQGRPNLRMGARDGDVYERVEAARGDGALGVKEAIETLRGVLVDAVNRGDLSKDDLPTFASLRAMYYRGMPGDDERRKSSVAEVAARVEDYFFRGF